MTFTSILLVLNYFIHGMESNLDHEMEIKSWNKTTNLFWDFYIQLASLNIQAIPKWNIANTHNFKTPQ
jgi:hypothetical protein